MTVEAIKDEIERLSPEGKAALAVWIVQQDLMSWDEQMKAIFRPAARAWLSWKRWTRNSAKAA
jgi:hypothetical protein